MPAAEIKIIVYSHAEYDAWKLESQNNFQLIDEQQCLITEQQRTLGPLKNSLQQKEKSAQWLRMQIEMLCTQERAFVYQHRPYPYYGNYYGYNAGGGGAAFHSLERDLYNLEQECSALKVQIRIHEQSKTQAQTKVNQLNTRNAWLATHILAAEQFLSRLENNPAPLVNALKEELLRAIAAYEEKHFFALSPQVRMSLVHIHAGLALFIHDTPSVREQQLNYLRLCGFLGDLYLRVRLENKDDDFLAVLAQVLNRTHVHFQGDLPGVLQTKVTAQTWVNTVKEKHASIFINEEQRLLTQEQQQFMALMQRLLTPTLKPKSQLQQKIMSAAQTVQAEVQEKIKNNEPVDFYFYTQIASNLSTVYNNPQSRRATKRLGDLAEHASGAASVSKKLVGSLLVVLGVLLMTASIAALVMTCGGSSCFSAWGVALGLGLMQAQVIAAVSFGLTSAVGAGLTLWGATKIHSGMSNGLAQQLVDVHDASKCRPI